MQPKINKINLKKKNTFQTGGEEERPWGDWQAGGCSVSWKGSCLQSCWGKFNTHSCQRWAHRQLFGAALNCPDSLLAHLCFHWTSVPPTSPSTYKLAQASPIVKAKPWQWDFLEVYWLRLHLSVLKWVQSPWLSGGDETRSPCAVGCSQKVNNNNNEFFLQGKVANRIQAHLS